MDIPTITNAGDGTDIGSSQDWSAFLSANGDMSESGNIVCAGGNSVTSQSGVIVLEPSRRPLFSTSTLLPLAAGGSQVLEVDLGPDAAGWWYWMLGSGAGSHPGLDLGGGDLLPLNYDKYFLLTATKPFLGIFSGFLGSLPGDGAASASLTLPPGTDPSLAGVTLHHAYVAGAILGQVDVYSNAEVVRLTL